MPTSQFWKHRKSSVASFSVTRQLTLHPQRWLEGSTSQKCHYIYGTAPSRVQTRNREGRASHNTWIGFIKVMWWGPWGPIGPILKVQGWNHNFRLGLSSPRNTNRASIHKTYLHLNHWSINWYTNQRIACIWLGQLELLMSDWMGSRKISLRRWTGMSHCHRSWLYI